MLFLGFVDGGGGGGNGSDIQEGQFGGYFGAGSY